MTRSTVSSECELTLHIFWSSGRLSSLSCSFVNVTITNAGTRGRERMSSDRRDEKGERERKGGRTRAEKKSGVG